LLDCTALSSGSSLAGAFVRFVLNRNRRSNP